MNMEQAVRSVLSQYATFTGRARRSEFWWWTLAIVIASIVAGIVDAIIGTSGTFGTVGLIGFILDLATFIPGLAVWIRRLHDTGRSGWWFLLIFIPFIGWIVLIVFACQDSAPANQYGANPKSLG